MRPQVGYISVIWHNWAKRDQIWAWLYHGHRWVVGIRDLLKSLAIDLSLVVNCYLRNKFHKKSGWSPA